MTADPVSLASRRLLRANAADGLGEIAAGLCFLSLALLGLGKDALPPRGPWWQTLNILQILVMCPGIFLIQWGLPRLRNRWFGAREGTMIPETAPDGRARAGGLAAAAFMTAIVVTIMLARAEASRVAIAMVLSAAAYMVFLAVISRQSGVSRYLWMGLAAAVASVAIAFRAADLEHAFLAQFWFIGAISVAAGSAALWRYLHTPPRVTGAI